MSNNIAIYNGNDRFKKGLEKSMESITATSKVIASIAQLDQNNATVQAFLKNEHEKNLYNKGHLLGYMKAWIDTLPEKLAAKQLISGIPVNMLIKLKVDEEVLNILEKYYPRGFWTTVTCETEYRKKYRRLCEMICGYGYNMYFIEKRFKEMFPDGMDRFVEGFAYGYSESLSTIAAGYECYQAGETDPKTQDIWKNWQFFLTHDCDTYTLEGEYFFMYHGGYNCSQKPAPYGSENACRQVNKGLYEALKNRNPYDFESCDFNYSF